MIKKNGMKNHLNRKNKKQNQFKKKKLNQIKQLKIILEQKMNKK